MISNFVSSQNDSLSGLKTYTYPSGKQSSTGYIENGKPIGKWINYFENGRIRSEGNWSPIGLDSIWIFYTEKGKVERSITYANNLKNGRYLIYDSTELISFDGYYINDTLQGPFKRFKNGIKIEEGSYQAGALNGELLEFDAGRLISIKSFNEGKEEDEKKINRLINGKKHGLWQTVDENGKVISQERYNNGVLIKDDANANVSFEFEKEFYPNGQLKKEYALLEGKKSGVQSNYDESGDALVSEVFSEGIKTSEGWFTKQGERDSTWQTFYPDGSLLSKGKYKDGLKDGLWIYYFQNSKQIEQRGSFQKGLPSGHWTWYYPNGQERRSEGFYRGRYDGDIIDYDSTGKVIQKRTYAYDEMEGEYYYFIGDHQEKGKMQNGIRQGKWVFNYANGKKAFVGKYKDGLANGKHKLWFDNGRRSFIINYKNGKLHGKKYEFYERGGLMHTYFYKNGKLISIDDMNIKEDRIRVD